MEYFTQFKKKSTISPMEQKKENIILNNLFVKAKALESNLIINANILLFLL